MECVEGLRRPDGGAISVLAFIQYGHVYQLQERIGVQLQAAQLQKRIKVREAVGSGRRSIASRSTAIVCSSSSALATSGTPGS
jgi:hypothetical protein